MIIERLKKLREEKLNRKVEHIKHMTCFVVLNEISKYFEDHPTKNKMFIGGLLKLGNFDEVYAMSLDIGKPYIIKKVISKYGAYLEVTCRVEYRPELYY